MRLLRTAHEIEQSGAPGGVLVPTMGALHAGHAALIRRAAEIAGPGRSVVVSIFVNPTQFNDPSDYERYPRTEEADLAICREAGASVVFLPTREVVYPPPAQGESQIETPPLPPVATQPGLEDRFRHGHFAGVCQVVLRLFRLLRPSVAVFGEKDWQQLRVVSAMCESLALGTRIEPLATVREPGGLAMSSRNRFLSPGERERALAVSRALCEASAEGSPSAAEHRMTRVLTAAGLDIEYAVVRDAQTLTRPSTGPHRALIAVRCGATRLIDNAPWSPRTP